MSNYEAVKIRCLFLPLLFLFVVGSVQARIGESYEELVVRYGKPKAGFPRDTFTLLVFEKEGYYFSVFLMDGKAEGMVVTKEKGGLEGDEVRIFLDKNTGEKKDAYWRIKDQTELGEYFELQDGEKNYSKTFALWNTRKGSLMISTPKGKAVVSEDGAKELMKKTEGF